MYMYNSMLGLLLVVATSATLAEEIAPDISAGERRAAVCFACHGKDGVSKLPGTPHLAGQQRAYLEKSLHAYREGLTRKDPVMSAMAKPLSDTDIANISYYFSLKMR